MNMQLDRRRLLGLLVALGASTAVNRQLAFGASAACDVTMFGKLDMDAIHELGREYLAQRPAATEVDVIAKLLAASQNDTETLEQLRTEVVADFTAGRIVNLAGWFVSETEGRVFAALSRCNS
ncbi:MAG TPA: hypothetical protein VGD45_15930 [Steroidobacter sp.]|uniref:hypothetical protein n=1 Tax=Steroidobacter sp. TaxID=1978227 RepID=UPI002EDA8407